LFHPLRKAGIAALAVSAAAGMLTTTAMTQASAAPAAPAVKTNYQLNVVGSDTIFCVDNGSTAPNTVTKGIFASYNGKVVNSSGNVVTNTAPAASINLGCTTTPATSTVPADSVHAALSYSGSGNACALPLSGVAMPWLYPLGSSAGANCLNDDQGAGNIAFTRSSRGRKSSDPLNYEFWAFALDAATWTHPSANKSAPKTLTPAQITSIYNCSTTDWSAVGGKAGTISRYYPQQGSGTGDFFGSIVMGGFRPTAASPGPCGVFSTSNPNGIHFVIENDGTQIASGDASSAILPYSFAVYSAQKSAKHIETNLTNTAVLGQINGAAPSATTITEANAKANVSGNACTTPIGGFCATRYVYHITWQPAPGFVGLPPAYYAAAIDVMGVPATGVAGKNSVCNNTYSAILKTYGFRPLTKAVTAESTAFNGGVQGSSFCREW
jgi:ABC-type phosphate transport system substrate-binding protein